MKVQTAPATGWTCGQYFIGAGGSHGHRLSELSLLKYPKEEPFDNLLMVINLVFSPFLTSVFIDFELKFTRYRAPILNSLHVFSNFN